MCGIPQAFGGVQLRRVAPGEWPLNSRKALAKLIVGRLSETVLLVHAEEEDAILDELRRMGQTPRVVR